MRSEPCRGQFLWLGRCAWLPSCSWRSVPHCTPSARPLPPCESRYLKSEARNWHFDLPDSYILCVLLRSHTSPSPTTGAHMHVAALPLEPKARAVSDEISPRPPTRNQTMLNKAEPGNISRNQGSRALDKTFPSKGEPGSIYASMHRQF